MGADEQNPTNIDHLPWRSLPGSVSTETEGLNPHQQKSCFFVVGGDSAPGPLPGCPLLSAASFLAYFHRPKVSFLWLRPLHFVPAPSSALSS